jgi:hypothetical protein
MPLPPFRWNAALARYIDPRGRIVARLVVRGALDDALAATGKRMRENTVLMRDRRISVAQWHARMKADVKAVHVYSTAAARGGFAHVTPAEWGRVGNIVKAQYGHLDNFAAAVKGGKAPRDGRLVNRADMYAQAGRQSYHVTDERVQLENGMRQERNILHTLDSCDGCIDETAAGWVPIGELTPVGTRDCLSRCKCSIEYRS